MAENKLEKPASKEQEKKKFQDFFLGLMDELPIKQVKVLKNSLQAMLTDRPLGKVGLFASAIFTGLGGIVLSSMVAPAILGMTGVPAVVGTAMTAIAANVFGSTIGGATIGILGWAANGMVKTRVKRRKDEPDFIHRYRAMKKKAGHLKRKNVFKVNYEDRDMIVRNGVLVAIHDETLRKVPENGGFMIPEGVEELSPDLFKGMKSDSGGMVFYIPSTIRKFDFGIFPQNSMIVFADEKTKGQFCKNLEYRMTKNAENGMYKLNSCMYYDLNSKKKIFVEGETFQSVRKRLESMDDFQENKTTYYSIGNDKNAFEQYERVFEVRDDISRIGLLSPKGQMAILRSLKDMMYNGQISVSEFLFVFSQTEYKDSKVALASYSASDYVSRPYTERDYENYYNARSESKADQESDKAFLGMSEKINEMIDIEIRKETKRILDYLKSQGKYIDSKKLQFAYDSLINEKTKKAENILESDNETSHSRWSNKQVFMDLKELEQRVKKKTAKEVAREEYDLQYQMRSRSKDTQNYSQDQEQEVSNIILTGHIPTKLTGPEAEKAVKQMGNNWKARNLSETASIMRNIF